MKRRRCRCRACGSPTRKGKAYCRACLARAARRLVEYQRALDNRPGGPCAGEVIDYLEPYYIAADGKAYRASNTRGTGFGPKPGACPPSPPPTALDAFAEKWWPFARQVAAARWRKLAARSGLPVTALEPDDAAADGIMAAWVCRDPRRDHRRLVAACVSRKVLDAHARLYRRRGRESLVPVESLASLAAGTGSATDGGACPLGLNLVAVLDSPLFRVGRRAEIVNQVIVTGSQAAAARRLRCSRQYVKQVMDTLALRLAR